MTKTESPRTQTPFLRGEQINLREITTRDVDGNYITWINDQEITQYLETGFFPTSVESGVEYVEQMVGNDDVLFLAIVDTESGDHIGNIKLGPINWIHRRAEIGILIGETEFWGRGIGTEAIRLITAHAFERLNLHKLTAGCHEENVGSKKAFKNVGFTEEGRRMKHAYYDGKYTDVIELGLLRAGFEA